MERIVLDTNCLISAISSKSDYYKVWSSFQKGVFRLCVTNEIIEEYYEVISRLTTIDIANSILTTILKSPFTAFIEPSYRLNLIYDDPDDNKFVDCAFAAQATYKVSNDRHFDILKSIEYPHIDVIKLDEFTRMLKQNNQRKRGMHL